MPQPPVQRRRPLQVAVPPTEQQRADWTEAVRAFVYDCRRRNLSPKTTDTYEGLLTNARTEQFRRDYHIVEASDLTAQLLKTFESELLSAGLSARSVMGYHRVFKTFASFCIEEGFGVDARILNVAAPKQEQRDPGVFSLEDEQKLLAAAGNERDRVLVEFMLSTGLRLSEVERVTVDDIVESADGAYVRVRQGKGRKDRIVPLDIGGDRFGRRLRRFAEQSRPRGSSERALFLSNTGGVYGTGGALTARGIQQVLYRLGRRTGIHVHPHKFRHTFATRAAQDDVHVKALQIALGHTTPSMALRYVQLASKDLLDAWRRRPG